MLKQNQDAKKSKKKWSVKNHETNIVCVIVGFASSGV